MMPGATPDPAPPALPIAAPPLVGRDSELALLREALDAACGGRGAAVLIGGEAGLGKTTLAEALCQEAAGRGALVLVGRCYDLSETPPYGPWSEALTRAPFGDGLPALPTAVLPPEREDGQALADQDAILRRVLAYLAALAAHQPLVLLLDDLHWADQASLDLLRFVARGLGEVPLLILVTYRTDEITRRHPLAPLLPMLVREARAERLDLHPLDEATIGALVAARYALGATDAGQLVPYLAARTEGNPFFLGEVLRTLEGTGGLQPVVEGWHLGDLAHAPVPTLLRQVIEGRLARLEAETQRLLAIAAVIGQEVPFGTWAAVADITEDALLEHTERAIAARLIVETADGAGVRFAHALVREALYTGTAAIRRRAWHRRAGEALTARAAPDPDAVAYHFRQAGDQRAVEWLVRASDRAFRAYAWLAAADRAEAALALLEQHDGDLAERGWLCVRLARQRRMGDQLQALTYAEQGLALAAECGDRALAVCAEKEVALLRCRVGQLRAGLAAMESNLADEEALAPADRQRLVAGRAALGDTTPAHPYWGTLAMWMVLPGRYAEATALAEHLLAAPPPASEQNRHGSCLALAVAAASLGDQAASARWFAQTRAKVRADGDHFGIGQFTFVELLYRQLPYRADRPDECQQLVAEAEEGWRLAARAIRADAPPGLARLPLLALRGDWDAAWQLALATRAGGGANLTNAIALLGPLALARGETALARELVRETLPAGPATEPGDAYFRTALILQRVAVVLAIDAGDLPEARAWLECYDRWLAWNGAILGRAEGQLGWADYHRATGDLVATRQHAERALAHASDPRQPLALLAAHRTLGELATTERHHAEAQTHLEAALALADACTTPYERALSLLALAEFRVAEGKLSEATTALATSRATLIDLHAQPALARADALAARLAVPPTTTAAEDNPFGLTAREVEVLRLAAQGLTDPQIGEQLYVSRHTINAHLRTIYGKLGVNTRTAAARLAAEHGLT
jgi:DNA-binding CsgD family transcriptional regulator